MRACLSSVIWSPILSSIQHYQLILPFFDFPVAQLHIRGVNTGESARREFHRKLRETTCVQHVDEQLDGYDHVPKTYGAELGRTDIRPWPSTSERHWRMWMMPSSSSLNGRRRLCLGVSWHS
ncbi:hypothetical protein BDV98DRAFT_574852 [Pterulicium gracile]|uniref:Uncharacterized protein n=1 Tax=Pterulicium gracile TaxID=1884261 RepID=A0A5C3Q6T4_9AGAR|nr:hypothetical protein BDV98DRAFT_574852 [Pterula gracilis]